MIDPKELRIGNLVEEPKGHVHKVERIAEDDGRKRYGSPITIEWLKYVGFIKPWNEHFWYINEKDVNHIHLNKAEPAAYWYVLLEHQLVGGYIQYRHQLQNLWFALTGEEL